MTPGSESARRYDLADDTLGWLRTMTMIRTSPPNSLILIMDPWASDFPEDMDRRLVVSTDSCVAVGCRMEHDGATDIHLQQSGANPVSGDLVFDGLLRTPNREVSVCTVLLEKLLSVSVEGTSTPVKVFANHPSEPNRIYVVVDSGADPGTHRSILPDADRTAPRLNESE